MNHQSRTRHTTHHTSTLHTLYPCGTRLFSQKGDLSEQSQSLRSSVNHCEIDRNRHPRHSLPSPHGVCPASLSRDSSSMVCSSSSRSTSTPTSCHSLPSPHGVCPASFHKPALRLWRFRQRQQVGPSEQVLLVLLVLAALQEELGMNANESARIGV